MYAADKSWHVRLPLHPEAVDDSAEAAWSQRPTFDYIVVLTQRYYSAVAGNFPIPETELARELSVLVQQLDFLLKSTYLLCDRYWELEKGRPDTWPAIQQAMFAIDVYAVSFYYLGHRAQAILRGNSVRLPHVPKYKMTKGVTQVRNNVLEHPDVDSFVSISGHSIHSAWGPQVRPNRDGRPWSPDGTSWMFVDARELIEQIQASVQAAYESLQKVSPA